MECFAEVGQGQVVGAANWITLNDGGYWRFAKVAGGGLSGSCGYWITGSSRNDFKFFYLS